METFFQEDPEYRKPWTGQTQTRVHHRFPNPRLFADIQPIILQSDTPPYIFLSIYNDDAFLFCQSIPI